MRKRIKMKKACAMAIAVSMVMSSFSQTSIMADEGQIKEGTLGENVDSLSGSSETIGDYECNILDDGVEIVGYKGTETDLTVPDTLGGYKVFGIGMTAFQDCGSLTSIVLPEGVTSIGSYAFQYCGSLTSITIPKGVTSIGGGAFAGCSSLTGKAIELWKEGREGINENSGGGGCYADCIGLENYEQIPEYWRNRPLQ